MSKYLYFFFSPSILILSLFVTSIPSVRGHLPLFINSVVYFSTPSSIPMSWPYTLTACIRVSSSFSFFPVGKVFANGPGDQGSIPGRVIPKTLKIVFDTSLHNTQQYKVRFKGKVEQSRERSSAPPHTTWFRSYWKGSHLVTLDYGRQQLICRPSTFGDWTLLAIY